MKKITGLFFSFVIVLITILDFKFSNIDIENFIYAIIIWGEIYLTVIVLYFLDKQIVSKKLSNFKAVLTRILVATFLIILLAWVFYKLGLEEKTSIVWVTSYPIGYIVFSLFSLSRKSLFDRT